ncbi:hypothetical protein FRC17_004991 [Serendipita sp. 399]|nr:hypothetical protein FRC17_004991 [Serendipita sp. 399]
MQLPQWRSKSQNPDLRHFIDTLNIPKVSDYAPPSLLLHTLGESSDSSLLDRIHQLFRDGNRYLVNTSGSGKTRLLLEGLCHHWGFYFTVNNQPDEVGSRDISRMLQTMRGLLPVAGSRNRFETVENNREILSRHFLPVLYIRVLALRLFLKHVSQMEGGIQEEHKRRWLLLQLASPYFTGYDLLSVVSVFFQGAFAGDLNAAITEELAQIQTMLGGPRFRLFTVIDEAQGIANTYMDFFRSEVKPDKPRPILSEILTLWLIPSMNYIISGTGLSQKLLEDTLSSRVGKIVVQETVHDLGAFDRGVPHVEYLKRYFPPRILESLKWEPFLSRLLYWLCGRYRFTASYIELLIQDNFDAPDGLLDQYAYALTGLRLSNSADFEDDYMDDGERSGLNLYGFDLSKLAKDEALIRQLAGFLFDYIFSGQSRNLMGLDNESLVEQGIARFKDEKNITTDEPLALLEAAKFLSTQPEWNLFYFITETLGRSYNKAARGIAVEHAGAYLLCLAFTQPRQLSEVFEFATDHPLKYEVAQLVALQRNAARFDYFPADLSSGSIPNYIFGCMNRTELETLDWLKDPKRTLFCFPAHTVGPDLIMILRLGDGTVIRVLVQFKYKERDIAHDGTTTTLQTTDPEYFVSWKTQAGSTKPKKKVEKAEPQRALHDLGTPSPLAGDYGIVRILAAFRSMPETLTVADIVQGANDAVATINFGILAKINMLNDEGQSLKLLHSGIAGRKNALAEVGTTDEVEVDEGEDEADEEGLD